MNKKLMLIAIGMAGLIFSESKIEAMHLPFLPLSEKMLQNRTDEDQTKDSIVLREQLLDEIFSKGPANQPVKTKWYRFKKTLSSWIENVRNFCSFTKDMRLFFENKVIFPEKLSSLTNKESRHMMLLNFAYLPYIINPQSVYNRELFKGNNLKEYLNKNKSHEKPVIFYVNRLVWDDLQNKTEKKSKEKSWLDKIAETNMLLIGTPDIAEELLKHPKIYRNILSLGILQSADFKPLHHRHLRNTAINIYQNEDVLNFVQKVSLLENVNVRGMYFNQIRFINSLDPEKHRKNIVFSFPFLKNVIVNTGREDLRLSFFFSLLSKWAPQLECLMVPELHMRSYHKGWENALNQMRYLKALYLDRMNDAGSMCIVSSTPLLKVLGVNSIHSFSEDDRKECLGCPNCSTTSEMLSYFLRRKSDEKCQIFCKRPPVISSYFFVPLIDVHFKQKSWNEPVFILNKKEEIAHLQHFVQRASNRLEKITLALLAAPDDLAENAKIKIQTQRKETFNYLVQNKDFWSILGKSSVKDLTFVVSDVFSPVQLFESFFPLLPSNFLLLHTVILGNYDANKKLREESMARMAASIPGLAKTFLQTKFCRTGSCLFL